MLPQVILFYGPPGCGKGTQINLLTQRYGMDFLDWGNEFRQFAAVHSGNPSDPDYIRARRVAEDMPKGPILTEDMMYIVGKSVIEKCLSTSRLNKKDPDQKNKTINLKSTAVVMDKPGLLPEESEWLSTLLKQNQIESILIHLPLSVEKSITRTSSRFYVPGSAHPWPSFREAKTNCPAGIEPVQRIEDKDSDKICTRYYNYYQKHRDQILNIYQSKNWTKVVEIDPDREIDTVFSDIKKALENF